jgi:hypothetical protein
MVTGRGSLQPWDPIFWRDTNYGALNEVVGNTPGATLIIGTGASIQTNHIAAGVGVAPPVFVGIGARAAGNVVPVPAGLVAGQLMLACLHGSTAMNPTNPGGWTELYNEDNPGGYNRDLAAFIKFAVGGETTFNFSAGGEGQIFTFDGVNTTTPLDVAIVQGAAYSGAGFTAPSITTATAQATLFAYDESRDFDTSWSLTTSNGYAIAVQDLIQACVRPTAAAGTYTGWVSGSIGGVQRGITIAFRAA